MTTFRPRGQYVQDLTARGHLRSSHWRTAFASVPREQFVNRFTVPSMSTGDLVDYDLTDEFNRDAALEAIYADNTLITQWDRSGTATSSSSSPAFMADMLEHLDAHTGHRVLEIGTGTGYNAALLAHALGDSAVTSIDVCPDLVADARLALNGLGYAPTVICGDGADGAPENAPYDRILATCGMPRIPAAWLDQLRPGGVIVANLSFGLAVLTGRDDGSVSGPFVGTAAFMSLRTDPGESTLTARDALNATTSECGEKPYDAAALDPEVFHAPAVGFLRALYYPHWVYALLRKPDHSTTYHLYDPTHPAWARATLHDDRVTVTYHGRDLWQDLQRLVESWDGQGNPDVARYGITVNSDGTHELWLDDPASTIGSL